LVLNKILINGIGIKFMSQVIIKIYFIKRLALKLGSELLNINVDKLGRDKLKADISVADGESR
jgi:hypothetical protein